MSEKNDLVGLQTTPITQQVGLQTRSSNSTMASLREKVAEESLNFFGDRIIKSDGLLRLQYYQQFQELCDRESFFEKVEYGGLYNLIKITEFLNILTQGARKKDEEPYIIDASPGKNYIKPITPFYRWKPSEWKSFRSKLVEIQTNMLRRDAEASINDIFIGKGKNKEIDPSRSHESWFTDKLFKVLDLFTFHEKLAPFREALEIRSSIASKEQESLMPLSLPRTLLDDFMDMVDEEEDGRNKKHFLSFLKEDQNTFHSPSTIRRLLDDPSRRHSFAFLLDRVNRLMRSWSSQVFENPWKKSMNLSSARTLHSQAAIKPEPREVRALKKLQQSRARLDDRVEDPLPDILAAAAVAKRNRKRKQRETIPPEEIAENDEIDDEVSVEDCTPNDKTKKVEGTQHAMSPVVRGSMLDKKKSATRLSFTPEKDSDSGDVEDPNEGDEVLPEAKQRAKVASPSPSKKLKSQQKMYEGRRIWTDAEKNAVIDGIKRFGIGKWAEIKKEYYATLRFRTSGQIKDCYRTLKKRDELGDVEIPPAKQKETSGEDDREEEEQSEQVEDEHAEER